MSSLPKTLRTKLNIIHLFVFVWKALKMTKVWSCERLQHRCRYSKVLLSCGLSIKHSQPGTRVANLAFLKPDCEFLVFFQHTWLFLKKKQTKSFFFSRSGLGSSKTLPELHIHQKSLMMRVYDHAGYQEYCKDFTVALKMFDVFNKRQMYDNVIMGKENASRDWNCIISMFLRRFNVCYICSCMFYVYMP